jgi:hypothetical protein
MADVRSSVLQGLEVAGSANSTAQVVLPLLTNAQRHAPGSAVEVRACQLDKAHLGAAATLREGLTETLTISPARGPTNAGSNAVLDERHRAVSSVRADDELSGLPLMLKVEEAARVPRIGRALAYELASRFEAGACTGLPVVRVGVLLRGPRRALAELIGLLRTSTDQCPGHTMVIGALILTTRARTPQYDNPAIRPSVTGEEVERLDERGRHQDDDAHRHEADHGGEDHLGGQLRRLLLHPLHALVT